MKSSHVATLHLTGLNKQARQINISPKMKNSPTNTSRSIM